MSFSRHVGPDTTVSEPSKGQNLPRHFNNISHQQSGQSYLTDITWPKVHITNLFKTTIRFQGLNVNIQCWKVYFWVCPWSPGARFTGLRNSTPFGCTAATQGKQLCPLSTPPTNRGRDPWPLAAAGSPYESEPTWLSLLCHWALYSKICLRLLGNLGQLHWQEAQHFLS